MNISAEELARAGGAEQAPASAAPPAAPRPFADRSPAISLKDVLIGVSFLLALGAFVLSVRNARQLRQKREIPADAPQHGDRQADGQRIMEPPPVRRRHL